MKVFFSLSLARTEKQPQPEDAKHTSGTFIYPALSIKIAGGHGVAADRPRQGTIKHLSKHQMIANDKRFFPYSQILRENHNQHRRSKYNRIRVQQASQDPRKKTKSRQPTAS